MALMNTTYGGGGSTTETSGAPQFQIPDNSEMMRFAYEIARRRLAERNAQQAAARQPTFAAPRYSMSPPLPQAQERPQPLSDDAVLAAMEKRNRIIELQQAQQPAPQRMMHGPGITPGYVMNPNAMSAGQRRMFLPQGSSFGAVPGFSSGAEGPAIDPLSDPYSDAYRELIGRGYTPAQIASMKKG